MMIGVGSFLAKRKAKLGAASEFQSDFFEDAVMNSKNGKLANFVAFILFSIWQAVTTQVQSQYVRDINQRSSAHKFI